MLKPKHPSNINQEIVDKVFARRGSLYAFPTLNPARTALIIIDLDLGTGRDGNHVEKIAENVNTLAMTLRQQNGTVAWVTTPIRRATENFRAVFGDALTDNYERMGKPGGKATKLWPELKPHEEDLYITKSGHSAFFPGKCNLHEQLEAKGIKSLLIVGAVTNVCCEASARDATELGYKVTMISDALIGQSHGLHEASLATFFRCYGDVRTTDNVIKLIRVRLPALPDSN